MLRLHWILAVIGRTCLFGIQEPTSPHLNPSFARNRFSAICLRELDTYSPLLLFGIKWWRGHARMIQMHLSIAISHQIRRRFLNMTFQLPKPSPLIPLIHNFHRNFFKILIHTLYPGCFNVQCQKDVLKEQLYWVSIG
jgi:hypothetical protein